MKAGLTSRINSILDKRLPERRLFLKSDHETRYIRLTPSMQLAAWMGGATVLAWTIVATAILLMDSIGSGNIREQAKREQGIYEARLNALSAERDRRAEEALQAQSRFNVALKQVSSMQTALLSAEDRVRELETGVTVVQNTLRSTIKERDEALKKASVLVAELEGQTGSTKTQATQVEDVLKTVGFLTTALEATADERDQMTRRADNALDEVHELTMEAKLVEQRNDRIFGKLEQAVTVSLEPLDRMFRAAGMPTDRIIEQVRRGYSGKGGPLEPLSISTKGENLDADSLRANKILNRLDRVNLYRIAATKAPFDIPIKSAFRYTSGFGPRWGRMHSGTDFAGPHGTPIYSTAAGVVTFAGRASGYGNLIKVQHEFGIETRYAHLSRIRVKKGQRVSRGGRIGDMGNTGRSTGTHLHYEVRIGGKAVNPMTYIKAAKHVF